MAQLKIKQIQGNSSGSILFIDASLTINEDNANFFWDDSNNRLGIGTNSPNVDLTVAGAINIGTTADTTTGNIRWDGTNFQGYNGTEWRLFDIVDAGTAVGQILRWDGNDWAINPGANENVQIGTGQDGLTGGSQLRNIVIGNDSLPSAGTSVSDNVIIGDGAALHSGGTPGTFIQNVVIGAGAYQTQDAHNTTDGSVILGYNAARDYNNVLASLVIIGNEAAQTVTGGYYNTVIGHAAQSIGTGGLNNTIIGYQAGINNANANQVIIGSQAVQDTIGANSTIVGVLAGQYLTSGNDNVAIGYASMQGQNGVSTSTVENTAVGRDTLRDITLGDRNTAIGFEAGQTVTLNSNNVFIGYRSGYNVSGNGGSNVVIGDNAGANNVLGTRHVMIGWSAGADGGNGVASENVLIGREAGRYVNGNFNIAIGYEALQGLSTGTPVTSNNSVAIGYRALLNVTSGAGNVAIGDNTLGTVTTIGGNIAIGNGAASQATIASATGGRNVIAMGRLSCQQVTQGNNYGIGFDVMRATTSGIDNICMGWNTGRELAGASSDNLVYGHNSLRGPGLNGTGTNVNNRNIVIGNDSASGLILAGANGYNMFLGHDQWGTSNAAQYNTIIGDRGCTLGSGSSVIAIGVDTESSTYSEVILIGNACQADADNQLCIGGSIGSNPGGPWSSTDFPITEVFIGYGARKQTTGVPSTVTISPSKPLGVANAPGGSFVISGGLSTGNADGGTISFQTYAAGPAGGTENTPATKVEIRPSVVNIKTGVTEDYVEPDAPATDGTVDIDWATGDVFFVELTQDITLTFSNLPGTGETQEITVYIKQDGTGSWTPTFPGAISWGSAGAPTITGTANQYDVIKFRKMANITNTTAWTVGQAFT